MYISCPLEQTLTQELSLSYTAVQSPLMLSRCSYIAHWYVAKEERPRLHSYQTASSKPAVAASHCSLNMLLAASALGVIVAVGTVVAIITVAICHICAQGD